MFFGHPFGHILPGTKADPPDNQIQITARMAYSTVAKSTCRTDFYGFVNRRSRVRLPSPAPLFRHEKSLHHYDGGPFFWGLSADCPRTFSQVPLLGTKQDPWFISRGPLVAWGDFGVSRKLGSPNAPARHTRLLSHVSRRFCLNRGNMNFTIGGCGHELKSVADFSLARWLLWVGSSI